jgi:hypothetical protein
MRRSDDYYMLANSMLCNFEWFQGKTTSILAVRSFRFI